MAANLQVVVVSGLSGAGKTQAIKTLEDLGFFCVDNLPPALVGKMVELCGQFKGSVSRVAVGIDIRGGQFFEHAVDALDDLQHLDVPVTVLFFEAADDVLVNRFKETRRRHPLAQQGGVLEGIQAERRLMQSLRQRADHIIDTSELSVKQLRQDLARLVADAAADEMTITVSSFGFKHGLPLDADLVFDVRFLPNPHYDAALRPLTGQHPAVQAFLNRTPLARQFFRRLTGLLDFLLPHYRAEGKSHLTVALGCTGGQHRSVALTVWLVDWLRRHGHTAVPYHRDMVEAAQPEA